jgi:hypothetical protein
MKRTLRLLSLAALLTTGAAAAMAAANDAGSADSKSTVGTQTGSQQLSTPATGNAASPINSYPPSGGSGTASMSSQSARPGVLGPTGSTQPDASHPSGSLPNAGGDSGGSASGAAGNKQ